MLSSRGFAGLVVLSWVGFCSWDQGLWNTVGLLIRKALYRKDSTCQLFHLTPTNFGSCLFSIFGNWAHRRTCSARMDQALSLSPLFSNLAWRLHAAEAVQSPPLGSSSAAVCGFPDGEKRLKEKTWLISIAGCWYRMPKSQQAGGSRDGSMQRKELCGLGGEEWRRCFMTMGVGDKRHIHHK